jgi:invasion protein IalB
VSRLPVNLGALRGMSIEQLFAVAETIAIRHDGHLAVLRFTTCWKVGFVPPVGLSHEELEMIRPERTLKLALQQAIAVELETAQ